MQTMSYLTAGILFVHLWEPSARTTSVLCPQYVYRVKKSLKEDLIGVYVIKIHIFSVFHWNIWLSAFIS